MKFCPHCGQGLVDEAAFCLSCGGAISNAAPGGADAYCLQCGERLTAGASLCPNCGAAQAGDPGQTAFFGDGGQQGFDQNYAQGGYAQAYAQPESGKKGRKAKGGKGRSVLPFVGIGAAVVAVVAAGAFIVTNLFGSPAAKFLSYQQELLASRASSPASEQALAILESGTLSTDLTISASIEGSDEISQILDDTSVVLKLDATRTGLTANAELVLMGSSLLSAAASYDKGELSAAVPEIDGRAFTADLSAILSEMSGMDIDLSVLEIPAISVDEWTGLIASYGAVVASAVTKDTVEEEKLKDVDFTDLSGYKMGSEEEDLLGELDDGFDGTLYTFTPEAESMEAMLEALAEKLEGDEQLRALILSLLDVEMLEDAFGKDFVESELGITAGGLEDQLDDAIGELSDQLADSAGDIAEAIEDAGITWSVLVEGDTVRMIRFESEEEESAFVYATSGTEADGMTELYYMVSYGYIEMYTINDFVRDGDVVEGETLVSDGYTEFEYSYELDQSKVSVLGMPYGVIETSIDGLTCIIEVADGGGGSADHIITLIDETGYYFEGMFSEVTVTINATETGSAKAPSGDKTDITNYSEAELEQLLYELEDGLMAYLEGLEDELGYLFASSGW